MQVIQIPDALADVHQAGDREIQRQHHHFHLFLVGMRANDPVVFFAEIVILGAQNGHAHRKFAFTTDHFSRSVAKLLGNLVQPKPLQLILTFGSMLPVLVCHR